MASELQTAAAKTNGLAGTDARAGEGHVLRGDAYDAAPVFSTSSIDLVVTSPPYWGLRDYGFETNQDIAEEWAAVSAIPEEPPGYAWYREHGGVLGLEPYPEWYVAHLADFFGRLRGALREGGSIWVNLGDTYFARWSSIRPDGRQGLGGLTRQRRRSPSGGWRHDKQLMLIPARFAIAMQEAGWILRNDLIWSKQNLAPRPERDRLKLSHEHFFHFVQRTPNARPRYYYDLAGAEPAELDVVRAGRGQAFQGHSATFPRELVTPRILTSTPPGGTVLDPFCGSGTALSIALEAGRRAIGVELSQEFAREAARRLHTEFPSSAPPEPTEMACCLGGS